MAEGIPVGGQMNTLEQEIAQIEQDLASKREALEQQQKSGQIAEVPHEKETLREVVGERIGVPAPASQPAAPSTDSTSSPQTNSGRTAILPPPIIEPSSYLSPELKEKVQELVNIAFAQTIEAAIKKAQTANNAALIDAFHDALVDELYSYLVERGKLQKL